MRTNDSITERYNQWKQNSGKRSQLKNYDSCEYPPIPLKKNEGNREVILTLVPDPLHVILLGPVNDVLENMEARWPNEMKKLYEKYCLKKTGEGPGGKFNGPSLKCILKENTIQYLERNLSNPEVSIHYLEYLRAIRELHKICTAKKLINHEIVIENFRTRFFYLFEHFSLSMTLKIHVIIHHYSFYFDKTGKTMRYTNGEFTESAHSTLRRHEELHNFKTVKNLVTPVHQSRSHRSLVAYNSKKIGSSTPVTIQKKDTKSSSCSSTPSSSPLSSPSLSSIRNTRTIFPQRFAKRYPNVVEAHFSNTK